MNNTIPQDIDYLQMMHRVSFNHHPLPQILSPRDNKTIAATGTPGAEVSVEPTFHTLMSCYYIINPFPGGKVLVPSHTAIHIACTQLCDRV